MTTLSNYFKMSNEEKIQFLNQMYWGENKSWEEIAQVVGTNRVKLTRDATKLGIKMRNRSEAQALRLKNGIPHPTAGKEMPNEVKLKLSKSIAKAYENASEEDKLSRKEISKKNWAAKSEDEKKAFRDKGVKGFRKASTEGSKLEKFVLGKLLEAGYDAKFHKEHFLKNELLQLDVFLPALDIAIEIDGPTHHEDLWHDGKLAKNQERDRMKNGLLLNLGISLIRVKHINKRSLSYFTSVFEAILEKIEQIKKSDSASIIHIEL